LINGNSASERSYKTYITAFNHEKIKPGDNLLVRNNRTLESYYVEDNGRLDWANIFNRTKAETMTTRKILRRKRWYIKIRISFFVEGLDDEESIFD